MKGYTPKTNMSITRPSYAVISDRGSVALPGPDAPRPGQLTRRCPEDAPAEAVLLRGAGRGWAGDEREGRMEYATVFVCCYLLVLFVYVYIDR